MCECRSLQGEGRTAEGSPGWGGTGAARTEDVEPLCPPPGPLARADLPPAGLRDSHISEAPAMLDSVEVSETPKHHDGAWFSVVAGPTAQSGEDPSGIGKRALGVRVLLFFGFAFEVLIDAFKRRLVARIENISDGAAAFALALGNQLHHLDGGNQDRGDKFLQWAILLLTQGFNSEALGLHGPEQLFDGPAQTIKADDAACIGDIVDLMGGEQEPNRRLFPWRRIDLAPDDERHRDSFRHLSLAALAVVRPHDLDLA